MNALLKMSDAEYHNLREDYACARITLPAETIVELRNTYSLSDWMDIEKRHKANLLKPTIDALKAQFPEASLVSLKSGSPTLTVEWSRDDGIIAVVWFDGGVSHRDGFHPDALVKVEG